MKLYAIGDLHLGYAFNREALKTLSPHPEDWLILGGDIGETLEHLKWALETVTRLFARVIWVPGNHDLWSTNSLRGEAKYRALVSICREYGVLTPDDPYALWPGEGGACLLAPLFLLYDYSFRPEGVPLEDVVDWAKDSGVVSNDERALHPDPYPTRQDWCASRCTITEAKLAGASASHPLVLINHYPLRMQLVRLRRIPRFSIWCGTKRTEDWHLRFRAKVVVSGHLHVRATDWIDGVRFEEVSLGYPRHWRREVGLGGYLREILPGPPEPLAPARTIYHR